MAKKGDISITTVIVAAIALIVLIVLIAIFTGKINIFSKTSTDQTSSAQGRVCNALGGTCLIKTGQCARGNMDTTKDWIDCSADQGCCH